MSTTLMRASREWATRPEDQRFNSLEALDEKCRYWRDTAMEANVYLDQIYVEPQHDENLMLRGRETGATAEFTNWSFGQLCGRVGAPASYLRDLPAELAAENINWNLKNLESREPYNLLMTKNDSLHVRAFTSPKYKRIWNADITKRLIQLAGGGIWQPAPAAFDGSRGLYASDHDMFAFMVDSNRRIFETAPGGGLSRGFFAWNSEVGASSFGMMRFFYEYCCGNHRVWGATDIQEIRIRHVGNADNEAFEQIAVQLRNYAEDSAAEDEEIIKRAHTTLIADTKENVLDKIFGLHLADLSKKRIEEAYELAEQHDSWYGDPKSVWGFVGGLTELATTLEHVDKRVEIERASGKIMQMAF